MRAVILVVCALFISGCGGGGGGTALAPAITLNPTTVTATFVAGTSTQLSVVATATAHLAGTLYVKITDQNAVLQPTATLTRYVTYALNEFDRSIVWQHDFTVELARINIIATLNPPAVSGGKTFVTTSPQLATWMYGFDASDGTPVFKRAFDSQAERYLAPTVDSGVVFEDGGYFGGMYAFDANVGTQSFYTMLQQYDEWTPAVDANYAYAYVGGPGSSPGQLGMVDRHTGTSASAQQRLEKTSAD